MATDPYAAAPSVPDPYAAVVALRDPYTATTDIDTAADRAHVDRSTAHALVTTESHGDQSARSGAGAIGMTQLMPDTARDLGVDPTDPAQNLAGGLQYFHQMLVRYGGNRDLALAAYNAGPGAVDKYHGIPPFAETRAYVKKVNDDISHRMMDAAAAAAGIDGKVHPFGPQGAPPPKKPNVADPYTQAQSRLGQQFTSPAPTSAVHDPAAAAAARTRLSGAITRVGNVGDAFTFAPANALLRTVGGDTKHGIYDYVHTLFAPSDNYLSPDIGPTVDSIANEWGFNAPADIKFWASQPGMRARLDEAKPKTAEGMALQLSLGMRSDLARLKIDPNNPVAPYATGIETAVAEFFNPAYMVSGELGGMLGATARGTMDAARTGQYGAATQKLAVLATRAPIAGNRFTRMFDSGGIDWEHAHAGLARDMNNTPHIAQDRAVSVDTFGGARIPDQVDIVHEIEAGAPGPKSTKMVGDLSIGDRARNVAAVIRNTENELRTVDPEMAGRLLSEPYFPHGGAWDLPQSQGTDAAWGSPSVAGHGGGGATSNVMPTGRIHDTLAEGQAAGLSIDPDWTPSGAMAMHQTKLQRYIALAKWVKSFEQRTTTGGKPGLMDIEYHFPMPGGSFQIAGSGPTGYARAMTLAERYGQNRALAEANAKGAAKGWTQDQIDSWAHEQSGHYRDVAVDEMRKVFRSQNPDHDFDSHTSLGMPMLKGKALHNAAVDAAIDSHPTLRRLQKGEGRERFAIHTQDEAPDDMFHTWLDNVNSTVRQGLIANVGYHPTFNLIPLALDAGVDPVHLARAMALDRKGVLIPKAWLDRAAQYKANAPKFGASLSMDPHVRAKLLTVPYDGLHPAEMLQKAFLSGSKWNQDVTFGWFEDRIAAVTMHHFEGKGLPPEAAARETRKVLGDYENLTPKERGAGMRNWQYFYTWMRGQLRYWGGQALEHPQSIMAPERGVQTANQEQGDQGSVAGGALSMRRLWGTDARGNPRYLSLPFPQFRYGSDVIRLGSAMSGDPTEAAQTATGILTSHLPPLAGLAIGIGATALMPAEVPKSYDLPLWDKNAPSPGAMWMQAMKKIGDRYSPGVIRAPVEAIAQRDPTLALGAVGPNVYTSPNAGSPQSKAAYGVSIDLRSALKRAHDGADHTLENHLYDLLNRVQDGDPMAVREAQRVVKLLRPPRRTP